MFNRPLLKLSVLLAAIGVPYVTLDEKFKSAVLGQWAHWTQGPKASDAQALAKADALLKTPASATPAAGSSAPSGGTTAASAPANVPLEVALRFDVTPEWVTTNWSPVTSVIGDSEHLGLRVMLVSGTTPSDVAGSLTYYFNQQHRLERITLLGVTGESSRLVDLAVGKFGMRPTQTKELGLFYAGDQDVPTSVLRLANLPVVRAEAPLARVQVAMDLRRSDVAKIKSEAEQSEKILPNSYRRW